MLSWLAIYFYFQGKYQPSYDCTVLSEVRNIIKSVQIQYTIVGFTHMSCAFGLAGKLWRSCADILHLLPPSMPLINHQISELILER